jgi:uncharacterized tellurite resistance protein B-like protein
MNRRTKAILLGALALLAGAALVLFVLPDAAWARAGGGQNFGGGGSDGGDGFGQIIVFLIWLAIEYPAVGVPLLIIAVVAFIIFGRKAKSVHTTRTIHRANVMVQKMASDGSLRSLDAMRQRDPGFSDQAFIGRASRAFTLLQEGWSNQDLSKVRAFISDGVRERFELQFDMQRAQGFRNRLEDIAILSADVAAASSDRHFDTVHVRFQASMRDEDVHIQTGKVLRRTTSEPFTEYWTFLRRPGAKTLEKGGLIEGICPNCGADLQISDAGQCEFCHALVTSGQYDWVLTEITQASEWSPPAAAAVPGLEEMSAADPAFNMAHIEDRASVMFWRLMKTYFHHDPSHLGSVALPELQAKVRSWLAPSQDGWWSFYDEAAVGAIEVRSIVARGGVPAAGEGGQERPRDRINVLVTWSGIDAQRNARGEVRRTGQKAIRPVIYVLVRNSGVLSVEKSGFRAAPCPTCGAPDEGASRGSACPYCGTLLNDGGRDWVLASIENVTAEALGAMAPSPVRQPAQVHPELLMAAMTSAMLADGAVDAKEQEMLQQYASARGIPPQRVQEIVAAVQANVPLPRPASQVEARVLLEAMTRMALADGKISRQEEGMLLSFGQPFGFSRADIHHMVAAQRKVLYKDARQAIKDMKRAGAG